MRIAYGVDTKTIEDWSQIVVIDIPDGLDGDAVIEYVTDGYGKFVDVVAWDDVSDSLAVALAVEGMDAVKIREIITTVLDAVVNV